jgi:predicted MFS family arabinose efflux permease
MAMPKTMSVIALAMVLSLGAAVSLGISRFCYGLLLPAMRSDLGWSYTLAGGMNTANAIGYVLGAWATPRLLKFMAASQLLWVGAGISALLMALNGCFLDTSLLLILRLLAGLFSAPVFISGGLLVAQLGARDPQRGGLLIGMYYSGTGVGLVLCAIIVPWVLEVTQHQDHGWRWAWWILAAWCAVATIALRWPGRHMASHKRASTPSGDTTPVRVFRWKEFAFGLAGYGLFGIGYIGYMTFVVAHLRAQGGSTTLIMVFYSLLGIAVIASSRLWAGLLDRQKGGGALAILNTLLAVATILPALFSQAWVILLSGLLFGSVLLSIVASTTALVRHNLPPSAWAAGISAFTLVFALGQVVGPAVVGWIADGTGGLARGLLFSAVALLIGAILASYQRPL